MKPPLRSIVLFFLLSVGFLITGVLTPTVLDFSSGNSDGLESLPPPMPLPSPPLPLLLARESRRSAVELAVRRPAARKILGSSDNDIRNNRFLIAWSDGTIHLMDSQSRVPCWQLVTGSPLLQSKRADPDLEYFIDFGDDGRLYEYSKAFGRRDLNATLEDLVHEATVVGDSDFMFGSKKITLHFLNETNGEVISRHRLPDAGTKIGVPLVEERLAGPMSGANGYILLVRTDYSLSSVALPRDPTLFSPDSDEPLWQVSESHISASYIKSKQSPNMGDNLIFPPQHQINIPVYVPSTSELSGAIGKNLMRPSVLYSYKDQQTLMLPSNLDAGENIDKILQSLLRRDVAKELPDDNNSDFSPSNKKYEPPREKVSRDPWYLNSQSGESRNDNISNIPPRTHSSQSVQTNANEMVTGLSHVRFALVVFVIFAAVSPFVIKQVYNKLLNVLKGKQSITPKKRKTRKAGTLKNFPVSQHEKVPSPGEEKTRINGNVHDQNYWQHPFNGLVTYPGNDDGRWVGKLFVSKLEIGKGSSGTVVYEGIYDGRPVAVKRLLRAHNDVASKEIRHLLISDQHPNIVRFYGVEQDEDFIYLSLERCSCSLNELIQVCSDSSSRPEVPGLQIAKLANERKVPLRNGMDIVKDLELWRANGLPSQQLLELMRNVVAGLAHLHELGIIHRDVKPQNVLISREKILNAKLSDMGISKRLLDDMSSLSHHETGCGSSGWQAQEQLLHGRQTRAIDLFSLGCVLFFCITKGRHPFGNHFDRDSNIINNHMDLFLVDHIPEAVDLLSQLLDPNPNMRPSAVEALNHPFFWNSEKRLAFLRDASDRVELEDRGNESELLKALENVAPVAFGGRWGDKLDTVFISDLNRYRKYSFDCTRDLLRVIRNKLNHYRELPEELQETLGPVPEGFYGFFSTRFPKLSIEVYKVIRRYCSNEDSFRKYFKINLL